MAEPDKPAFFRLLEIIRGAHAAPDAEALVRHELSALPALIPCDATLCAELTAANKAHLQWVRPSTLKTPSRVKRWDSALQAVAGYYLIEGDGNARKTSDFTGRLRNVTLPLSPRERNALAARPFLAVILPLAKPLIIALHREEDDFTEDERRLLNLVRPHLIQAHRGLITEARLRGQLALLLQGQHQMLQGVILLSPDGRVMEANEPAVRALKEYFRPLQIGRLPEPLLSWALAAHDAATMPLVIHRDDARLTISRFGSLSERMLLLEVEQRAISIDTLRHAGGLTRRESDVLAWVTEGKTNPVIGEIMGISSRTVQTHLIHIYEKLGVETRTAAAAWALAVSQRRH
ncbi:MAG TPA: LuxR C-terminal-related transcriptional regulator [Thermoanaerobaculia bacterium]|nr:LuxR C-terminal-related transcriptional regulator [Thermoanaerobaculia bacterium]